MGLTLDTYGSICGSFFQDLLVKAPEVLRVDRFEAALLVIITILVLPHDCVTHRQSQTIS